MSDKLDTTKTNAAPQGNKPGANETTLQPLGRSTTPASENRLDPAVAAPSSQSEKLASEEDTRADLPPCDRTDTAPQSAELTNTQRNRFIPIPENTPYMMALARIDQLELELAETRAKYERAVGWQARIEELLSFQSSARETAVARIAGQVIDATFPEAKVVSLAFAQELATENEELRLELAETKAHLNGALEINDINAVVASHAERELARERGYLISCPWCGERMDSRPVSAQMLHLIPCGERMIGDRTQSASERTCTWRKDGDGIWHTGCDQAWVYTDSGTPKEHGARFCYHCGGTLIASADSGTNEDYK